MKEHDTNLRTNIAELDTEVPADLSSDDFDPARVFADPVAYLAGLGLKSELTEARRSGLAAAA